MNRMPPCFCAGRLAFSRLLHSVLFGIGNARPGGPGPQIWSVSIVGGDVLPFAFGKEHTLIFGHALQ